MISILNARILESSSKLGFTDQESQYHLTWLFPPIPLLKQLLFFFSWHDNIILQNTPSCVLDGTWLDTTCSRVNYQSLVQSTVIMSVLPQGDGVRERLSEQQYRRLVDYVTRASQFLSPSTASLQLQPTVTLAEPPPSVTKSYRYLVDPAFAKVFVSTFTVVKNKALCVGFHW